MNTEGNIVIFKDPNPYDELNYGWLLPATHLGVPIEYIADIDVPYGMPYKIVSQSLLPVNFWQEIDFYTFDFSNPDGYGSGSYEYIHNDETIRVEQFFTGSYDDWKEVNDV
jgi:hypothetical protein